MEWSLKPCSLWVDRLTSLPDELLIRILSLLPTKDAAATSILCRRLRQVFPLITSLDFDVTPISHCLKHPYAIERYPSFVAFVDRVLQAHRSKYITKFRLQVSIYNGCKRGCFPDLKSAHFNKWISFPLTLCGLRELDLCILVREPGYAQLPPPIFTCLTLEVLKLEVNLGLDQVIALPSYHLPNLKVLVLSASFISDDDFLPRLLASCPLLEDLTYEPFTEHVRHVTIRSTSLRRLCLGMHKIGDFHCDNNDFVLIHTPNLEYLEYIDNVAFRYSILTMHHLARAKLCISELLQFDEFEVSFQQLINLIRPVSNVQHLALLGCFMREFDYADVKVLKDQLPVFPNVNHLELGGGGANYFWNKLLLPVLNCVPVLETLDFKVGLTEYYEDDDNQYMREPLELEGEFFRRDHAIPSCCRYHLKRIVIKHFFGLEREVKMIQFFLRHALVLEELVVYRDRTPGYPFPDQMLIENTLRSLPKASVTCSIQVL